MGRDTLPAPHISLHQRPRQKPLTNNHPGTPFKGTVAHRSLRRNVAHPSSVIQPYPNQKTYLPKPYLSQCANYYQPYY